MLFKHSPRQLQKWKASQKLWRTSSRLSYNSAPVQCSSSEFLMHQAQITSHINNVLGSHASFGTKAASFLRARQPVLASGAQLTTNVRVMAADAPFPTIAEMVEDLVKSLDHVAWYVRFFVWHCRLLVCCRRSEGASHVFPSMSVPEFCIHPMP